ncbi:hypothetical protein TL16_g12203 [Triparma laevis f. inornata]|uniref:Uncharacterized protein n=1 Tax=Triparma laevis f. inornata TaxID=1714386 RepID=A0A9W7BR47_9STRA|nr:hypothetical protein TL16_g12203 [Triparma laevis f. inornata]
MSKSSQKYNGGEKLRGAKRLPLRNSNSLTSSYFFLRLATLVADITRVLDWCRCVVVCPTPEILLAAVLLIRSRCSKVRAARSEATSYKYEYYVILTH